MHTLRIHAAYEVRNRSQHVSILPGNQILILEFNKQSLGLMRNRQLATRNPSPSLVVRRTSTTLPADVQINHINILTLRKETTSIHICSILICSRRMRTAIEKIKQCANSMGR